MNIKNCRLCKSEIKNDPLLSMSPFPCAAQYYPKISEFSKDKGINLNIYQCPNCNLIQLCSEPVDYYKEVITAASFSPDARKARLNEFTNFVNLFNLKDKKAIEIGCGKGAMVEILNTAGLDAIGLEYSPISVEHANSNGNKVVQGYLCDDFKKCNNLKYDVFVSLNYIEHQPDIKEFIQSINKITSEDAIGYITVPNVNYLLKTNTLYEFVADHLVYFTEETICRAFEINGFDVISSELINNDNDIALTVKKRKIQLIKGQKDVDTLVLSLQKLISNKSSEGEKVAVWGAGHRTLALLSIAKIDNIEFIVDSADFKQGKYSPVTHMKIVSPQTFKDSAIDVIIIMLPGLYPNEVVKIVKEYDRELDIYKLEENIIVRVNS